jgi:hypothetical protein
MLFKLHTAETLSIEIIVDLWYYVIAERETNQSMINKEITKMKKFTRIITAVMAAATIAVTTTSVCASARTLETGEEITEEVVNQYAAMMKAQKFSSDVLLIFSHKMHFYPTDVRGIMGCNKDYNGAWIDYWATLQRSCVRQEKNAKEGKGAYLDQWSRG